MNSKAYSKIAVRGPKKPKPPFENVGPMVIHCCDAYCCVIFNIEGVRYSREILMSLDTFNGLPRETQLSTLREIYNSIEI